MNRADIERITEDNNSNWKEYRIYILESLNAIKSDIKINNEKINDLVSESKVSKVKIASLGLAGGFLFQLLINLYSIFK